MRLGILNADTRYSLESYYLSGLADNETIRAISLPGRIIPAIKPSGVLQAITQRILEPLDSVVFNHRLPKLVCRSDIDVLLVFKGWNIDPQTLRAIRNSSRRTLLVNYNPDDPLSGILRGSSNKRIRESIPYYDLYVTFSADIAYRLYEVGARTVAVIPFAYHEPTMFAESEVVAGCSGRFLMYGAWDPERHSLLSSLTEFPIDICGHGWIGTRRAGPSSHVMDSHNLYGAELRRKVKASIGVLNPLRQQNRNSHNMRTFEVPAMGGLQIAPHTRDHHALFGGSGAVLYDSTNDLVEHMREIRKNPANFLEVRAAGSQLVRGHTYRQRSRQLAELLLSLGLADAARGTGALPE